MLVGVFVDVDAGAGKLLDEGHEKERAPLPDRYVDPPEYLS